MQENKHNKTEQSSVFQAPASPFPPETTAPSFPFSQTPPLRRSERVFSSVDRIFVWLSIAVGYLLIAALPLSRTPLGSMLTLMLLYAFGGIYLRLNAIRPSLRSTVTAVVLALFSLSLITTGNNTIRFFSWLGVALGFLFFLADASGLCGKGVLSNHLLTYAKKAVLLTPVAGFSHFFPALGAGREEGKPNPAARMLGWIVLGLAVALIPTAIVVALLSYDSEFNRLLNQIFQGINLWKILRDLILGFGVAILLFGVLFESKAKRNRKTVQDPLRSSRPGVLPRPLLCAAVTPILLVYVLFFFSQRSYYLSALTHVLPKELTYAEYARQGFFELCWVCGINAVLLILFNLLIVRQEEGKNLLQRIYSALISVFTLILITTALSKMILYIDSYGLTQKRVYASWLMCLLALIFLAVLIRQILPRFPLFPTAVIGALVLWAVIAFPNTDAAIAQYNVKAYLQGDLQEVDVIALEDLGASAVPALTELESTLASRSDSNETLTQARAALIRMRAEIESEDEGFFSFNLPDARAKRCYEKLKEREELPIHQWFDLL